ncbi:MAG: rRNA processing protein [Claussenomyces sp. TS43310]|nr:MAG: rRNA processing protein [Claussenomyces sp. TS43310]
MGSSTKKKKDKKKDFQKPKLRVGKTKPKADNFTDTSFKSKFIVINQQSLTTTAPSRVAHFTHYVSLASSSKSETQRRDALSYLATTIASQPVDAPIPVAPAVILPKLLPLILDGSANVRAQLLKLLRLMPPKDISARAEMILLYIRAGMTHLAADIRNDAVTTLEWLLESVKEETVACPGGWVKTLKAFMSMMGWTLSNGTTKWSSLAKVSFGKGGKSAPRHLMVLAQFLTVGLGRRLTEEMIPRTRLFPFWDLNVHMIPTQSNPYSYLNLFGPGRDEEGEMYTERESRQRVFSQRFQSAVEKGVENGKKEGGEIGRAAAVLGKVLAEGMGDYSNTANYSVP